MKKIVLITTGQPAINPRIVKEADSLTAAGYDVTVLYCFFIQWASELEHKFLPTVAWKHRLVGGSPNQNKFLYHLTRLRFKLARILNYRINEKIFAERAQARAFDELLRAAKNIKADLYIAHNLGALPVAVKAARHHKAKAGFDFEDYHRGELSPDDPIRRRVVWLENKYVPNLSYYSSSSPLIAKLIKADNPEYNGRHLVLLNCFPKAQQPVFRRKKTDDETLRLFWFSQTVGKNRGLETVVAALNILNNPAIRLTLAGRCDAQMKEYLQKHAGPMAANISFAGMIRPSQLPAFAAGFDVGLASETGFSSNNNAALSNKVFTYLLAGNSIILSNTEMQELFNETYKVGESYKIDDPVDLADKIKFYLNRENLEKQRLHNYDLAGRILNWDKQAGKLIKMIECLSA